MVSCLNGWDEARHMSTCPLFLEVGRVSEKNKKKEKQLHQNPEGLSASIALTGKRGTCSFTNLLTLGIGYKPGVEKGMGRFVSKESERKKLVVSFWFPTQNIQKG